MASFGDFLNGSAQWLGHQLGFDQTGTKNQAPAAPVGSNAMPGGAQISLMNDVGYSGTPTSVGQVLDASTGGYNGGVAYQYPSSTGAGGGGTAPAYNSNYDPTLVAQARGQVSPLMAQLNALYDQLPGNINAFAADQRGVADQNFNTQMGKAGDVLKAADNGTDMAYAARGTSDSSFHGNALDQNKTDFNHTVDDLTHARDDNYSTIGKAIAGSQAMLSNRPNYDLSQYQDVNSLMALRNQLDQHITNLQGAQRNLDTAPKLKALTEATAPVSGLDKALKTRLDSLAAAAAPAEAKFGIGSGYISSSQLPDDQKAKMNQYLSSLLGPSTKAA